ncbi:hypothetical protein CN514_10515 [Bacillus sp. AFS001701]|uniref:hypothetical protein n=2 Tax=Bacillaceae TaxID=186817 RepID=UPI000BF4394D|nr:hypothetical protein [Bacillus sp. AFS001701]PET67325.1 hypothetical protein CN514_10515 [Bacillus sp. AFS001701]
MKIKLLYYAPFLLTVVIAICYGIPETLSFIAGWLYNSIFYVGLPILLYFLYFLLIGKYLKKTIGYSIKAVLRTMVLLVIFLIFSVNIYKPLENIIYFSNKTKTELTKRSLTLFQERMKTKGEVEEIYPISRIKGWMLNEVSVLGDNRALEIDIIPINKNDKRSEGFYYVYKEGKWLLEFTEAHTN